MLLVVFIVVLVVNEIKNEATSTSVTLSIQPGFTLQQLKLIILPEGSIGNPLLGLRGLLRLQTLSL